MSGSLSKSIINEYGNNVASLSTCRAVKAAQDENKATGHASINVLLLEPPSISAAIEYGPTPVAGFSEKIKNFLSNPIIDGIGLIGGQPNVLNLTDEYSALMMTGCKNVIKFSLKFRTYTENVFPGISTTNEVLLYLKKYATIESSDAATAFKNVGNTITAGLSNAGTLVDQIRSLGKNAKAEKDAWANILSQNTSFNNHRNPMYIYNDALKAFRDYILNNNKIGLNWQITDLPKIDDNVNGDGTATSEAENTQTAYGENGNRYGTGTITGCDRYLKLGIALFDIRTPLPLHEQPDTYKDIFYDNWGDDPEDVTFTCYSNVSGQNAPTTTEVKSYKLGEQTRYRNDVSFANAEVLRREFRRIWQDALNYANAQYGNEWSNAITAIKNGREKDGSGRWNGAGNRDTQVGYYDADEGIKGVKIDLDKRQFGEHLHELSCLLVDPISRYLVFTTQDQAYTRGEDGVYSVYGSYNGQIGYVVCIDSWNYTPDKFNRYVDWQIEASSHTIPAIQENKVTLNDIILQSESINPKGYEEDADLRFAAEAEK